MTRRVLEVISDKEVYDHVALCICEGESLAEGKPVDGREHLIWSYERRKMSESIEKAGHQSAEYWALSAVNLPLNDGYCLTTADRCFGYSARAAIVCHGQKQFDPDWLDLESYHYLQDLEAGAQLALAQDIFGNPFRPVAFDPAWRTGTAVALANTMYDARDFAAMPILADALEEAGCDVPDVLNHCRDPKGVHVRGCWVVDLVLGKS
jgi:hypothetical protein